MESEDFVHVIWMREDWICCCCYELILCFSLDHFDSCGYSFLDVILYFVLKIGVPHRFIFEIK